MYPCCGYNNCYYPRKTKKTKVPVRGGQHQETIKILDEMNGSEGLMIKEPRKIFLINK